MCVGWYKGVKHLGWTLGLLECGCECVCVGMCVCVCVTWGLSLKRWACLNHSHPLLPRRLIHFKKMSPPLSPGAGLTHTHTHMHTAHYSAEVTATSAAHTALPLEADQSVLLLALMNYRSQDWKREGEMERKEGRKEGEWGGGWGGKGVGGWWDGGRQRRVKGRWRSSGQKWGERGKHEQWAGGWWWVFKREGERRRKTRTTQQGKSPDEDVK